MLVNTCPLVPRDAVAAIKEVSNVRKSLTSTSSKRLTVPASFFHAISSILANLRIPVSAVEPLSL